MPRLSAKSFKIEAAFKFPEIVFHVLFTIHRHKCNVLVQVDIISCTFCLPIFRKIQAIKHLYVLRTFSAHLSNACSSIDLKCKRFFQKCYIKIYLFECTSCQTYRSIKTKYFSLLRLVKHFG